MKSLKEIVKPPRFDRDQGYSWWRSDVLGVAWHPPIFKKVSITFGGGLLCFFGVLTIVVSYLIFPSEILRAVGWLMVTAAVLSSVFSGENGRRFLDFLVPVRTLSKVVGIPANEKPVSRTIVRIVSYGLLGIELALLTWWLVFTAPPAPTLEEIGDYYVWILALRIQALNQLILYWWLFPILCVGVVSFLRLLDWAPVAGWLLRLTRIPLVIIIPVLAAGEARMILTWFKFTLRPVLQL